MIEARRRWLCIECGYVYDEAVQEVRFEDLPDNWICPECGSPKSDFQLLAEAA